MSPSICPAVVGSNLVFPTISSISISIFLGKSNRPKEAINISFIVIIGTVFPFATYVRIALPKQNPTITPILPNLFNIHMMLLKLVLNFLLYLIPFLW